MCVQAQDLPLHSSRARLFSFAETNRASHLFRFSGKNRDNILKTPFRQLLYVFVPPDTLRSPAIVLTKQRLKNPVFHFFHKMHVFCTNFRL